MKYLIIGAGGTGGCIGAYMTDAGKDVTLIARGAHLEAMKKGGLRMETVHRGNFTVPVKACDMKQYEESGENPDVIFVCVKGYSLQDTVPFIRRVAAAETVVIPILNIYGTGSRLQEELPDLLVTDGCIYVAAEIREPGCILQKGEILKIVYGVREPSEDRPVLLQIKKDLEESSVGAVLSGNIRRDALQKFAYISPAAACGLYYDVSAGQMQKPGEIRDTFAALVGEIGLLAESMGVPFEEDPVKTNLEILDNLAPEASTSMQRDIWQNKQSEIDGLIFEVVRMAGKYGADLPVYQRICSELRERGYAQG